LVFTGWAPPDGREKHGSQIRSEPIRIPTATKLLCGFS
jgi:hypothetical protein